MYCQNCGNKILPTVKFCPKCGTSIGNTLNKIDAEKSSNTAQETQTQQKSDNQDSSFRDKIGFFLDPERKKNFIQALLLYILIALLLTLVHSFESLQTDSVAVEVIYSINAFLSFLVILLISYIKGLNNRSWIWAFISGVIGYLFGLLGGLVPLLYLLTRQPKIDGPLHEPFRKQFILKLISKGIGLYLLGIILTLGSLFLAGEGGTFYFFWGLLIWGFWLIIKAIYYCARPWVIDEILKKDLKKQLAKKEQTK